MRGYCFVEIKDLNDLEVAGFKLLKPENVQCYAIQTQEGEYPEREALLFFIGGDSPQIWQVLPTVEEKDWVSLFEKAGIKTYANLDEFELNSPELAIIALYKLADSKQINDPRRRTNYSTRTNTYFTMYNDWR